MHRLDPLFASLGVIPKDVSFYEIALTHRSYLKNPTHSHNERLEFLGDRVLGLVMADCLYHHFPNDAEGDLAKRQAVLVSKVTLLDIAKKMNLSRFLFLSQALQRSTPERVESLYANALEAFIAALYLDLGFKTAEQFIHAHWQNHLEGVKVSPKDPKSTLQEWAQGKGLGFPIYEIIDTTGPAHAPQFTIKARIDGYGEEIVIASSRRLGEQKAALHLLNRIQS